MSAIEVYSSLFISSFLSSTLLPGHSELTLKAFIILKKYPVIYLISFASIGNIFDTKYKSGGFEQGRNANYRQLKEDKSLDIPVFGNKYWFGRGTTYFLSLNYRF